MSKKPTGGRTSTTTVTRTEVERALAKAPSQLPADEEKAVRMLHGVGANGSLALGRIGQESEETRAVLLDIELELLKQWRARAAAAQSASQTTPATEPAVEPNPRRDRIVSALRTKKPSR